MGLQKIDLNLDTTPQVAITSWPSMEVPNEDQLNHYYEEGTIGYCVSQGEHRVSVVFNFHNPISYELPKSCVTFLKCENQEQAKCEDGMLLRCIHPGCDEDTVETGIKYDYYCFSCAAEEGHCLSCGTFYAGTGQLLDKNICDNCNNQESEGDGASDDQEYPFIPDVQDEYLPWSFLNPHDEILGG